MVTWIWRWNNHSIRDNCNGRTAQQKKRDYFACIHSQNKQKCSSQQLRSREDRSRDFSSTTKCAWFFSHPPIFLLVNWNELLGTTSPSWLLINLRLILRCGEGLSGSLANIVEVSIDQKESVMSDINPLIFYCYLLLSNDARSLWSR